MPPRDSYATRKDFVAYFLQSPITREPEFEIRISGAAHVVNSFQHLLKIRGVQFRRVGLEIFPPPSVILLEKSSLKEALGVLHAWLKNNKDQGIEKIQLVWPDGTMQNILSEQQVVKAIAEL